MSSLEGKRQSLCIWGIRNGKEVGIEGKQSSELREHRAGPLEGGRNLKGHLKADPIF